MSTHVLLTLSLATLATTFGAAGASAGPADPDAHALFLANCATCHGETGDGRGTTPLDRPARSFRDGGFSFGNTPEALFRTISTGIPGTPMPGFSSALTEPERRAVAAYVRTLGPPLDDGAPSDSVLVVTDRARVVQGLLPALTEQGSAVPRGLLLGTVDGLTFQYRVDDVRLLAVRHGGFVQRADWIGRGGSPLEPLGRVVHLCEDGSPAVPFELPAATPDGPRRPLCARLASTWVRGRTAELSYRLTGDDGSTLALVTETPCVLHAPLGSGFARRVRLVSASGRLDLRLRALAPGSAALVASFAGDGPEPVRWNVIERGAAGFECVGVPDALSTPDGATPAGATLLELALEPGVARELTLATLYVSTWDDAARAVLRALDVP